MASKVSLSMHSITKTVMLALLASLPLHTQAVPLSASEVNPIEVGSTAPDVRIHDMDGQSVQLSALISKQPAIVIFYRGSWCPYCTRHLAELGKIENEILKAGYQIIAISPDRPETIVETSEGEALAYSLYSDSSMEAAQAFGLAFQVDTATLEKYDHHGIDLEKASGQSHHWLPVPALYVLEKDGRIKFRYFDANYKERLSSEALLQAIR